LGAAGGIKIRHKDASFETREACVFRYELVGFTVSLLHKKDDIDIIKSDVIDLVDQ